MEEIGPATTRGSSSQRDAAAASGAPSREAAMLADRANHLLSEIQGRRAERQREVVAKALPDPNAKAALLSTAVAGLLEFAPTLSQAMTDMVAATPDPAARLSKLIQGLQMYCNICKVGDKLS